MDPVQQFMQATGTTDPKQAAVMLEGSEGDVELAIAIYQSSVSSKPAAPQQSAAAPKPKPKPTGGIMTMAQLTALDTGDDEDDDGEDYFAGGAKNSGVAVHGPGKKKENVAKVVESVFNKARSGGAKTDEEYEKDSKSFAGSGHRLGDTNATGPSRPTVQGQPERLKKVVTFYRQGFVVADGPLRSYSDPANHQFLKDVQEGYVPRELEAEAAGRELETELVDCKNEDYTEPERPRYNAFGGSGHSLGATPTPAEAAAPPMKSSGNFQLDANAPTISVQVRFHDGSKATAKLNTTHTIMDLRAWIEQQKPISQAYDLMLAFPPKPLSDLNQTVQAAGLAGAAVNQKLR